MKSDFLNFSEAINDALDIAMKKNKKIIVIGLGVDDPKRTFGTTKYLKEKYGDNRVFDMPTAENAMTGLAIGSSLNGFIPIISHQRVEFSLLAIVSSNCDKINYWQRVGARSTTFSKSRIYICPYSRFKSSYTIKPKRCKRTIIIKYRGQKSNNIF